MTEGEFIRFYKKRNKIKSHREVREKIELFWNVLLKALEEDQLPWLQVIDEFPIPHTPAKVATLYAIPYLPTLMLIAPDGKIVGKAKDKHELKTWLDERLAKKK